ncbi:unnamed protein product, partial [Adineta steineri]
MNIRAHDKVKETVDVTNEKAAEIKHDAIA